MPANSNQIHPLLKAIGDEMSFDHLDADRVRHRSLNESFFCKNVAMRVRSVKLPEIIK